MTTTVVNIHHNSPYDVYIGRNRASLLPWGNPFSHMNGTFAEFKVATRQEAIDKYREWIVTQPDLMAKLITLKGKRLGCWCVPAACHGQILAEMADALPDPPDLVGDLDLS